MCIRDSGWEGAPIEPRPLSAQHGGMRILVLWNRCLGVSAAEDSDWVRGEAAKLSECDGVAALEVHRVESAALRYPRQWDWCLELRLGGEPPCAVVRQPPCAAFLADLRLLGTHPTVFVLPEAV